jgi:hypothetical protein
VPKTVKNHTNLEASKPIMVAMELFQLNAGKSISKKLVGNTRKRGKPRNKFDNLLMSTEGAINCQSANMAL